ncbi:N-acetylmuramoyl-L-alanine amidase [Mobiluncus porci]|uniref:N-acetylmuramoyl-L-alanine amidase n=1 Tax=Mobiluncus porci TaxID=2652278 RepID=A0A7K0K540_9ACTO|nr:peptidoglycan recognition family protein [Mobiluncus porci]MST50564.1 N-acetylmuramoyl-L-alanine amidase [Mobiluncus porci]
MRINQIWSPNRTNAATHKRLVVIHTMESPEGVRTAEDVARYFQNPRIRASAHYCVDADSVSQCVPERQVAWAAPGCNHDGIQIELAGRAGQTPAQWQDAFSRAELDLTARLVAEICDRWNIPIRHLSNGQLGAGWAGIIGHNQASDVYRKSDHWDPGPNFPWDEFIQKIQQYASGKVPEAPLWKENNMLLREPDGSIYEVSGGVATVIGDPNLVQALMNGGVPLIQIQAGQIGWWHKRNSDDNSMGGRVREMKDLLTDYPGMSDTLKRTSILRGIAGKLGITSRTN